MQGKNIGTLQSYAEYKKSISKLIKNKTIVVINSKAGQTSEIKLNKNYDEWQNVSSIPAYTSSSIPAYTSSSIPAYTSSSIPAYTKERKEKEKNKENIYSDFFESIWKLYPIKKGKGKISKTKKQVRNRPKVYPHGRNGRARVTQFGKE